MGIIDTIKERPLLAGGVALAAIVVVIIIANAGGSAEAAPSIPAPSDTGQGTALQVAQMQATSEARGIDASLQALTIQSAANVAIERMKAETADNANYYSYKAQSESLAAQVSLGTLQSSLAAQIAAKQIDAQLTDNAADRAAQISLANIQATQNITTQQILSQTLMDANRTQADMFKTQTAATTAMFNTQTAATQQMFNAQIANEAAERNARYANENAARAANERAYIAAQETERARLAAIAGQTAVVRNMAAQIGTNESVSPGWTAQFARAGNTQLGFDYAGEVAKLAALQGGTGGSMVTYSPNVPMGPTGRY